jgi:bifunctional DNA-binding transcriptional regulator/antitoxin component of YhaV-PrlF toxin-antitoxin module
MGAPQKPTTTLSDKGQLILPQAILQRRQWGPGTRLQVEDTPDGVLLKAAPMFAPTRPQDVFGSAKRKGPPISVEDMDAAVVREAKRRRARGRY